MLKRVKGLICANDCSKYNAVKRPQIKKGKENNVIKKEKRLKPLSMALALVLTS